MLLNVSLEGPVSGYKTLMKKDRMQKKLRVFVWCFGFISLLHTFLANNISINKVITSPNNHPHNSCFTKQIRLWIHPQIQTDTALLN